MMTFRTFASLIEPRRAFAFSESPTCNSSFDPVYEERSSIRFAVAFNRAGADDWTPTTRIAPVTVHFLADFSASLAAHLLSHPSDNDLWLAASSVWPTSRWSGDAIRFLANLRPRALGQRWFHPGILRSSTAKGCSKQEGWIQVHDGTKGSFVDVLTLLDLISPRHSILERLVQGLTLIDEQFPGASIQALATHLGLISPGKPLEGDARAVMAAVTILAQLVSSYRLRRSASVSLGQWRRRNATSSVA